MIILGGLAGQLDNRGRTVEDLAAAVENEVVVGGDEGKGDGEGGAETLWRYLPIFIPRLPNFSVRITSKDPTVK
jgi:hypothetical protein